MQHLGATKVELDLLAVLRWNEVDGCSVEHTTRSVALSNALEELQRLRGSNEELRRRVAELEQWHNGHMPDCAGSDPANGCCGCGYLQGQAYRDLRTKVQKLEHEKHKEINEELLAALKGLYEDNMDYIRINSLGAENNHCLVQARVAIAKAEGGVSDGH